MLNFRGLDRIFAKYKDDPLNIKQNNVLLQNQMNRFFSILSLVSFFLLFSVLLVGTLFYYFSFSFLDLILERNKGLVTQVDCRCCKFWYWTDLVCWWLSACAGDGLGLVEG